MATMNIIQAMNRLRSDIQTWVANNLKTKVNTELKTDSTEEYKVLSDNNFTDADKNKLDDLSLNAGTVTSVSAGTGLSGGPITSSGTITLKTSSISEIGGIKVGSVITTSSGANKTVNTNKFAVHVDKDGLGFVAIPEYSNNSGDITGVTAGTGLSGGATSGNATLSLKTASTSEIGGIKTGYNENNKNYAVKVDNSGNAYVNVPWIEADINGDINLDGYATQDWVTSQGYTKNTGTVTGVKVNGETKTPTNGVVDLGTLNSDSSNGFEIRIFKEGEDPDTLQYNRDSIALIKQNKAVGAINIVDGDNQVTLISETNMILYDNFIGCVTVIQSTSSEPTLSYGFKFGFTVTASGLLDFSAEEIQSYQFAKSSLVVHIKDAETLQRHIAATMISALTGTDDIGRGNGSIAVLITEYGEVVCDRSQAGDGGWIFEYNADGKRFRSLWNAETGEEISTTEIPVGSVPETLTWTDGDTAGPIGVLSGTGMNDVSFQAIPSADATKSGIVTTGVQTFAGNKTFTGEVTGISGFFDTSDERLKDFQNDVEVDFEKLSKLPKKYFTWKDGKGNLQIGTSAQAVREIYPELVHEDENGKLSVSYNKLSIIALSAIDALYKKNQELENRLFKIEEMLKYGE